MKRVTAIFSIVLFALFLTIPVFAHETKGTVASITATELKVTVVDESTRKPATMTFELNRDTKIYRGTKVVTLAEAKIVKGEQISVTIDHDGDQHLATVLKLGASKKD